MRKKVGILMSLIVVCLLLNIPVVGAAPSSGPKEKEPSSAPSLDLMRAWENAANPLGNEYEPGELLIKFVDSASSTTVKSAMKGIGAKRLKTFKPIGTQHWQLGKGMSVEKAIKILSKPAFKDAIEYAEPNYIIHACDIPDDPLRNELYGMHNLGQTGGTTDADIDALEAWVDGYKGSSSVVVGVIDSGIDYNHEDLSANIWTNPNEIADNSIDDDGNGYIDDVRGWDFKNDDNDPIDDNGHGTHCAGTIGAIGNNGKGVVGVNWNVKLMPLKFLGAGGSGKTDDAVDAVLYATDKNVRITSNSWGGGRRSKTLENAIKNSESLFIAAAGNKGSSKKMLPAGYNLDNIISVAATDHDDKLASFSNYGSDWVDLGAPGVNILSSTPGDTYGTKSGTSMAAPHVSGVAALVMAKNPTWTNSQVKNQILETVDSLDSLSGKTLTGGRVNARAAVGAPEFSDSTAPAAVTNLAVVTSATTENSIKLTWTATGDDGSTGTAYLYDIRYVVGSSIPDWDSATQASGEPLPQSSGSDETFTVTDLVAGTQYAFAIKVSDEVGGFSSLSNVVSDTTKTPEPGAWVVETVDATGIVGTWNGLALASDGTPHIVYGDYMNHNVKHAKWTGSAWVTETIPDSNVVDRWNSIAVGSDGNPRIAYFDDTKHDLKYTRWTGSSWSIETVHSKQSTGNWNSITLDASNNPYISFRQGYDNTAGCLMYAKWTGSKWELTKVDANKGAALGGTSIKLDSSGYPHIAYRVTSAADLYSVSSLRYAKWDGSTWSIETVDGVTNVGAGGLSMDLDGSNNAQISYYDGANKDLLHASWTGSTWYIETVDSDDDVGSDTSMVLDSSGYAHISYFDDTNDDVKYAYWTGSVWEIEIVDGDDNAGWWTAIALGTDGKPRIAYHDITTADLNYARKTG